MKSKYSTTTSATLCCIFIRNHRCNGTKTTTANDKFNTREEEEERKPDTLTRLQTSTHRICLLIATPCIRADLHPTNCGSSDEHVFDCYYSIYFLRAYNISSSSLPTSSSSSSSQIHLSLLLAVNIRIFFILCFSPKQCTFYANKSLSHKVAFVGVSVCIFLFDKSIFFPLSF